MTFFVDANVLIYSAVPSRYRAPCLEILGAIVRGEAEGRTSTAALEEVWYIELTRQAGSIDGLTQRGYEIFAPLLPVTDAAFRHALSLDASALGPNDRLHAGTCVTQSIEVIVSADSGFDEVRGVRRIDPLDPELLRELRRASAG